ncbi:hypothetical protein GA0115249_117631 [Streptomyces sp. PpalLS-921]|nr:hypothetical protein GA0115249_117631 [Streptomyces sp. PpalLS-921]
MAGTPPPTPGSSPPAPARGRAGVHHPDRSAPPRRSAPVHGRAPAFRGLAQAPSPGENSASWADSPGGQDRAAQDRAAAQGSGPYLGGQRGHQGEPFLDPGGQHVAAGPADLAGQDHAARVEHGDDRRGTQRDAAGQVRQERLAPGAPVGQRGPDRGRGARLPRLARTGRAARLDAVGRGQVEHGGRARQRVEPALAVDGRGHPRRAGDRQEADLPRPSRGAAPQGAVQHDGGTDAVAQPEQGEGVAVEGGPGAVLRHGGQIGLVLHDHGRRQPPLELLDQAPVPGRESGGVPELPRGGVDQARGADGDAVQRGGTGRAGGPFDGRDGLLDGGPVRGVAVDRQRGLRQRGAEQVRDHHGDAVGPYVQSGQMGPVGGDPVEPGVGAAPP